MRHLPARLLLWLAACLVVAGACAGDLRADEAESAAPPAAGVSQDELGTWLMQEDAAVWVGVVGRFLPLLLGLVLLVFFFVRRRDGSPKPTGIWTDAPQAPTPPFSGTRGLLVLGSVLVGMTVLLMGVGTAFPEAAKSFAGQMLSFQLLLVSIAAAVVVGRVRSGARSSLPTVRGKVLGALWTVCVAAAIVVPLTVVATVVLKLLGVENVVYGPIQEFMTGADSYRPWLVAFMSVVLAPISEEGVFRGLLYPALRGQGTERWRVVGAAVLVSLVFAAIHGHPASFLPLFALAMVFTWVFEKTNSLATVMIAHGIWNLLTVLPLLVRISS